MQSQQDISAGCVYRLLGVGERVIGFDRPDMGHVDRCRRSLQHSAEVLAVHRRQGRAPVSSFDQLIRDWKSQGGDQIRAEFEQAIAAATA